MLSKKNTSKLGRVEQTLSHYYSFAAALFCVWIAFAFYMDATAGVPIFLAGVAGCLIGIALARLNLGQASKFWMLLMGNLIILLVEVKSLHLFYDTYYYLLCLGGAFFLFNQREEQRYLFVGIGLPLVLIVLEKYSNHRALFEQPSQLELGVIFGFFTIYLGLAAEFWFFTRIIQARNSELEDAVRKISKSDELKGVFLSQTAHDLQNSLNSILLVSSSIGRGDALIAIDDAVSIIDHSVADLSNLVNSMVDKHSVEFDGVAIKNDDVDLRQLAEELMRGAALRNTNEQVALKLWIDPALPRLVTTDALRIRQVSLNLLSNAFKYGIAEGSDSRRPCISLRLCFSDKNTSVTIIVEDNGTGIPAGAEQDIFRHSFRLKQAVAQGTQGTGIGLGSSADIATNMGGALSVKNLPTSGAQFTFEFPVTTSETFKLHKTAGTDFVVYCVSHDHHAEPMVQSVVEQNGLTFCSIGPSFDFGTAGTNKDANCLLVVLAETKAQAQHKLDACSLPPAITVFFGIDNLGFAFDGQVNSFSSNPIMPSILDSKLRHFFALDAEVAKKKQQDDVTPRQSSASVVLLVDDQETYLNIVQTWLSSEGIQSDVACNGSDAMALITQNDYQTLVLDGELPDTKGPKLAREVIEFYGNNNRTRPTLIFLSGRELVDDSDRVLFDVLLTKPITIAELRTALNLPKKEVGG